MTINQRFKKLFEYLKEEGLVKNREELGQILGDNAQGVTDLASGKKRLTPEHFILIQEKFPRINLRDFLDSESLLKTERRMKVTKAFEQTASDVGFNNENNGKSEKGVPYYDFDVSAGPVEMFDDLQEVATSRIIMPGVGDCQLAINVWGDSMYPHLTAGDVIICRKIEDKRLILFGEMYLIVTKEFRTVKFIKKHEDPSMVILHSSNPEFDDVEIMKDDILHVYFVKTKVQRKLI